LISSVLRLQWEKSQFVCQMSVYVIFTWRDYRKENGAEILGVYRQEDQARQALSQFATEFFESNGGTFEKGQDFVNVINGSDCQVYEITKMPII